MNLLSTEPQRSDGELNYATVVTCECVFKSLLNLSQLQQTPTQANVLMIC